MHSSRLFAVPLVAATSWLLAAGCATAPPPRGGAVREVRPHAESGHATRTRPPAHISGAQEGACSWYGREQHGHLTANGEHFDMYALTAAHRTLPMQTRVRVTNLKNGRSVVVRINDRGPYSKGRIIDVSYAAARTLEMLDAGVVPARVEVLGR